MHVKRLKFQKLIMKLKKLFINFSISITIKIARKVSNEKKTKFESIFIYLFVKTNNTKLVDWQFGG